MNPTYIERKARRIRDRGHDKDTSIDFADYLVHEPFDEKWKTNCRARIAQTAETIVMVGPKTAGAPAVVWETAETARQGHPMFGVQISSGKTFRSAAARRTRSRWACPLRA